MTTMGLRGVLACAFIISTVSLTGMAPSPTGAVASEPHAGLAEPSATGPGVFEQFKRNACQISLAATRSDRSSSRDRSQQCGE